MCYIFLKMVKLNLKKLSHNWMFSLKKLKFLKKSGAGIIFYCQQKSTFGYLFFVL